MLLSVHGQAQNRSGGGYNSCHQAMFWIGSPAGVDTESLCKCEP